MPSSGPSSTSCSVGPADIIELAVELGDEHGWCQHRLEDGEGRRCAVGLLTAASNQINRQGTFHTRARRYSGAVVAIAKEIGNGQPESIPRWNDLRKRTWSEVRDAFLHAAKELRNGQDHETQSR